MGQCETRPRSTTGSVDSSSPSGNARASRSPISRIFSAVCSIQPAGAVDQRAEIRERGDHHVDGLQVATLVQFAERGGVELAEAFFLDGVEPGKPMLRAIVELDVQYEGLQQVVFHQRGDERGRPLDALVQHAEYAGDAFEVVGVTAVLAEYGLALSLAQARAVEVDVHHLAVRRVA